MQKRLKDVQARDNQQQKLEKKVAELSSKLEERVKELNCIYRISDLMAQTGKSLETIFDKALEIIQKSWQYPEKTCVRLILNEKEIRTKNYKKSQWVQSEPLVYKGKTIGKIEAGFITSPKKLTKDPFLPEEYHLLKVIALKLSQVYSMKEAELALMQREIQYRTLISNIPGIVYRCAIDQHWTMYYISDFIKKVSGYPASDFILNEIRSFASIIHPEDQEHVEKAVLEGVKKKIPYTIEYRIIDKNGGIHYVYENGQAVQGKTPREKWLDGIIFDVSETVQLKERLYQSQKMEAFGHLVGGVSHNLDNLLKIIREYSNITLDFISELDPMHVGLKEINRTAEEAENLMQQLIAFGKQSVLKPQALNMNEFFTAQFDTLKTYIDEKHDLQLQISPTIDEIKIDLHQFETVIRNLLKNSSEAMKAAGTVIIKTRNARLDDVYFELPPGVKIGDYVMFSVSDTGSGIDIEIQSQIFDPFFSTKNSKSNIGLGLTTVYGIIKENDGHILFESEKGQGTTFKVYFPAVKSN